MSMISLSNITFYYPGSYEPVFQHLSAHLDTDWHLGLTGRNGRGKTTLLRLLLGSQHKEYGLTDYQGSIVSQAPFCFFPMPVEDSWEPAFVVAQQLCPNAQDWELRRQLGLLELDEDTLWRPYALLSGGEKTKLQLAALFLQEGAFPLIDEPTNHLDLEGRRTVARFLQKQRGFLLVSHDRTFLDGCVDHILSLDRDGIQLRQGNFSSWYQDYQTRVQSEREQNERLKKEIRRLEAAARRTAQWSDRVEATKIGQGPCDRGNIGHKAAKMMKRSKSIEARQQGAIEEKKQLLRSVENVGALKLQPLDHFARKLVEVQDLAVCYDGKPVCEPLRLEVYQGEKICLQGTNGCGKTSLLRLVAGEQLEYTGTLTMASGLKISVVPQDTTGLSGSLSDYLEKEEVDLSRCLSILRNLGFERRQFEIPLEQYSQGQKKKVLIARSLCQQAHLYLWDEPLNYIDLFSRLQIEQLLQQQSAAMLFVEHDAAFCQTVATRILTVTRRKQA